MAYQATIIPVMIASPGDVPEEREIIRQVIHDWNDVNAALSKVMLAPVGWETHSSPELGVRPQELINTRLLKDCDLLIGVFWTRLGTPTGKASSGSVEEIMEHVQAGKPAMIYFSSKPVVLDTVNLDQLSQLKNFKTQCKDLGLIEVFDSPVEFRTKLSKQLQLCLLRSDYIQSLLPSFRRGEDGLEPRGNPSRIHLSQDGQTLLTAAAMRDSGIIGRFAFLGGKQIQAGGQIFGEESAREAARWESALEELVENSLVAPKGSQGQVFELMYKGWSLADELKGMK